MKPHRIAATSAVLFAATLFTQPVPQPVSAQTRVTSSTSRSQKDGQTSWLFVNDDLLLEIKGEATFSDDYTAIETLSPDGRVRIRAGKGSEQRLLVVTHDGAGGLKYDYSVGGKPRPFDGEARAWMTAFVDRAARDSGLDSKRRVARLLKQGGPEAVLKEIEVIGNDFAKRLYFENLLDQTQLKGDVLARAIRLAMREIGSDFEKRQALSRLAEQPDLTGERLSLLIEATATIGSDFEKTKLLTLILDRTTVEATQMAAVLKAARKLSSDFEKTNLLMRAIEIGGPNAANAPDFFPSVEAISSDFEKGRLLNHVTQRLPRETAVLTKVVKAATGISSDFEKANVLRGVAALRHTDPALVEALRKAINTVTSDYERERIQSGSLGSREGLGSLGSLGSPGVKD